MRGYFIDPEGKCFREFDERLAELEKSKKNADDDKKWLSEETIRRREELDDKYWKKTYEDFSRGTSCQRMCAACLGIEKKFR